MADARFSLPDPEQKAPTEQAQAQPTEPPKLRELEPEALKQILDEHKKWLESGRSKETWPI